MSNNMRCALKIRQKYRQINTEHSLRNESHHNYTDNSHQNQRDERLIREAIELFQLQTKNGPTYVCTVCHRALFSNQV